MLQEAVKEFVVIDVETGGFSPQKHAVLQVAALLFRDGGIAGEFEVKSGPFELGGPCVTEKALAANGIDLTEHMKTAVKEDVAFGRLKDWFQTTCGFGRRKENRPWVVGQNLGFDLRFLKAMSERVDVPVWYFIDPQKTVDTLQIARTLQFKGDLPQGSAKLEDLAKSLGVAPVERYHDALEDCRVTLRVFIELVNRMSPMQTVTVESGPVDPAVVEVIAKVEEETKIDVSGVVAAPGVGAGAAVVTEPAALTLVPPTEADDDEMTSDEAIALADEIIELCEGLDDLSPGYDFAQKVAASVQGVKEWVEQADYVTPKQEGALHGWHRGISQWYPELRG